MCVGIAILLKASALRARGGTSPSRTHPLPVPPPPPPPPLPKFLDPPLYVHCMPIGTQSFVPLTHQPFASKTFSSVVLYYVRRISISSTTRSKNANWCAPPVCFLLRRGSNAASSFLKARDKQPQVRLFTCIYEFTRIFIVLIAE